MTDDIGLVEPLLAFSGFRVLDVYEEPAELSVVVVALAVETVFCRTCGSLAEAQTACRSSCGICPASDGRSG